MSCISLILTVELNSHVHVYTHVHVHVSKNAASELEQMFSYLEATHTHTQLITIMLVSTKHALVHVDNFRPCLLKLRLFPGR